MAHGKNAEQNGHPGKEYWSRRQNGGAVPGRYAKVQTHRKERRTIGQEIIDGLKEFNEHLEAGGRVEDFGERDV